MKTTKKEIRQACLSLRDGIPSEQRMAYSKSIFEKVMRLPAYTHAEYVLCYVNYRSEVDTGSILQYSLEHGKKVFVPKVSGDTMDFYQIFSLEELAAGYKQIPEPRDEVCISDRLFQNRCPKKSHCLMIMPGSAFDPKGNRIGYGKGYYDQYLTAFQKEFSFYKLAVCFAEQIVPAVPFDVLDIPVDCIVTNER